MLTAIESAFLDLTVQTLGVPPAALLVDGKQRERIEVLGYLFFVGDYKRTTFDYQPPSKREQTGNKFAVKKL